MGAKVTNIAEEHGESAFLSIDEVLSADDVKYLEYVVPEWSTKPIRLGSLSAGDLIEFVEANEGPAKKTAGLRLIIKSLVDGNGHRIGKDSHLDAFKNKDARVCNRLAEVILELNGLGEKAQAAAKNASGEAATAASPTA